MSYESARRTKKESDAMIVEHRVTPTERVRALRHAIARKGFVRIIEAHSGLSGIIAETARVVVDDEAREYDGPTATP